MVNFYHTLVSSIGDNLTPNYNILKYHQIETSPLHLLEVNMQLFSQMHTLDDVLLYVGLN